MFRKLIELLYPPHCIVCLEQGEKFLCADCQASLRMIENPCVVCGTSLLVPGKTCGACLKKPPAYDQVLTLYQYDGVVAKYISHLKFYRDLFYADLFAELMGQKLTELPDVIIPVPLHRRRLFKRGFNQSLEIARRIGELLNVEVDYQSCRRIRHTKAQSELPAKDRLKNVRDAFAVNENFRAKSVAIVDDVMTTGNTVNELAKVLRKVGVKEVLVWCVART